MCSFTNINIRVTSARVENCVKSVYLLTKFESSKDQSDAAI
jgi:hypothetical protein